MTITHNSMMASVIMEIRPMINENTTFKQYLKESGYSLMQYQEEVYNACIAKSKKYEKIDIYFLEEIEEAFNKNVPVDELADELCKKFDYFEFGEEDNDELEKLQTRAFVPFPESTENPEEKLVETSLRDLPMCKFCIRITPYKGQSIIKYATAPAHTSSIKKLKERMENCLNMDLVEEVVVYPFDKIELSDEPVSDLDESTNTEKPDDGMTDGESYTQWKEYVFKYLDKRIETDKIKELGTYIKDFIKQEYDNGEPSWFNVAESVVNYARTNYPQAVKPRESNAFSITENKKNEAFIQDDRGLVSFINLSDVILKRAGVIDENGNATVDNEQLLYSAATYIAAFYAAQSMPQGGMAAWGTRDLKSFMAKLDKMKPEDAVRSTRSIMVAKVPNDYKNEFIENVKNKVRKQNADDAEKRRQAYLNSEEHRHMQDPGWRGPNGTWSND